MSLTRIVDDDTGHELFYDPYSLDDSINGYESCRKKIDSDRDNEKIDQKTHDSLIFALNTARRISLRLQDNSDSEDITLLLSE